MFKLNHKLLANSFFWFAVTCAIFGIATQYSDKIWIAPGSFYLELAIISMLGGIFVALKEKYL
ncbi:MAG: hypothetical protein ABIB97_00410 [Patescibacteria group bacterium]